MLFVGQINQDFQNKNIAVENNFSGNINHQLVFSNDKNMYIYCKNFKKHTGNTVPKKLILISKNKFKVKSKCAICVTKKTFIHEIEDNYDLDSELQNYL